MCQTLAFPQSQCLGGRFECARQCVIVDGLPARSLGVRRKCEVADSDALEVPELAVLSQSALMSPTATPEIIHMATTTVVPSVVVGLTVGRLAMDEPCYVACLAMATLAAGACESD
jgi:hypothetical protein